MKNQSLLLLALLLAFAACKPEEPGPDGTPYQEGVFILNEGNFLSANATLDFYNIGNATNYSDIFQTANGAPLGDVLQSMTLYKNKAYIVVNNSQKVEVCDVETMKREASISGFTSPRYLLPVSAQKAYVSDLFGEKVSIVNLESNSITGSVSVPGWSERMIKLGKEVWISNSRKVYILNSDTDQLTDSVAIGLGGNGIVEDREGKVWVLCGGDFASSTPASLHRIDPGSREVLLSLTFDAGEYPGELSLSPDSRTLYYVASGGVYAMTINATALPAVARASGSFYGLGIHPETGDIYATDPIDYSQRGKVYIYGADGTAKGNFQAGIIPGEVVFW